MWDQRNLGKRALLGFRIKGVSCTTASGTATEEVVNDIFGLGEKARRGVVSVFLGVLTIDIGGNGTAARTLHGKHGL